jgi:hypothetical protein
MFLHRRRQTFFLEQQVKQRQLIIEHPFRQDRTLVEPAKFEEKTSALYRLRLPVKKDSTEELLVKEEKVISEEIAILSSSTDSLIVYSKNDRITKKVRDALLEAIRLKQEMTSSQNKLASLTSQVRVVLCCRLLFHLSPLSVEIVTLPTIP